MQNGKSPGCDGFTVGFYQVFCKNIKQLFMVRVKIEAAIGEISLR